MSFDSEYLELRKKRKKQEEKKQTVSSGNTLNTTKQKKVESGSSLNDELMDIAPVRFQSTLNAATQPKKSRQKANEPKLDFFKTPDAFKDGYNIGDVTKSILGTAGDIAVGAARGFAHTVEGAGDLISYGIAGASDLFGNYDFADSLRAEAKKDLTEKLLGKQSEIVSKNSVLGRTSQGATEMIGQLATMGATGGASELAGLGKVGSTILTTGVLGTSATGSGMSEAYQGGATDEEALTYGLISGAAESISEMFFGGLGKSFNAVGFSSGLLSADDILAKKLTSKLTSQIAKNCIEYGIKAGAEGFEEILAGVGQSVGKKLTYMSEKELADILANENLLEQFVVGAIGSGFAQSVDLYNANKSGTDFITGLTQNEQAVVDKEVKNRVAEKEADGKKLTNREKNKIYDAVIKDLDKGYISTDTIEEVLGGKTYKSYKDTIDNETALQNEFNTLNKMKQSEMTGEQTDRRAELKQKLEDLKNNSNKTQLKERLSNDVFNLVKGSRLVESYNETARRGQTFEADLSKYDAKQQEVVKKAVESGILNNTNRTHEFVDMVAKISADKGVIFDFSNNEKIKESGFAVDGKTVNGYVDGNGNISLNIDSSKALNSVVGHEITHILEGTELHDALKDVVKQYATTKGEYDTRLQTLSKLYEGVDGANIENELTADLIGDYLFTDSDFINKLSTENRNVFKKIYDEIKYLCKIATAGSKEARELEKVKRQFEKAYRETANTKTESDTKYSLAVVEKIQPTSNKWHRTLTTEEAKARFPKLWDVTADESEVRNPTQISSTVKSYRRIYDYLQSEGFDGTILDASSGLGYGTRAGIEEYGFNVEDIEPYPDKDYNPKYKDYSSLNKKYDVIISNAVLNVLPQDQRDALVIKMGELLNDGGRMFVSTRGRDVDSLASNKNNTNISPMEWFVDSTGSYQKGFTKPELVAYLQDALGDGFTVKPTNLVSGTAVIVTKDGGVKYSLSAQQEEYFKDSVVRDDEGNLKVMYHGTSKGGHTVFDTYGSNYGLFGQGSYFTDNKSVAESYTNKGKGNNKQVYESYLNITNPLDMDAQGNIEEWQKAFPDADFSNCNTNEEFYRAVEEFYADQMMPKWEVAEEIKDTIAFKMGYDGITHIGGGRVNADGTRHQVYIAFEPEQIKNIDNIAPTKDADIRYSLSAETETAYNEAVKNNDIETAQKIVDEVAEKSMPDSKIRDENGKLLTVYHGSPSKFTVFEHRHLNTHGTAHGRGFYFTEDKNLAEGYQKKGGQLLEGYLNITNPMSEEKVTIRKPQLVKLIQAVCEEEAKQLVADGGYDSVQDALPDTWISGYVYTYGMSIDKAYRDVADILYSNDNDVDIVAEMTNVTDAGIVLNKVYEVLGYDGVIYTNERGTHEFVSLISNQFKSADAITYDDNGNVIPLAERFNEGNKDIRYSLSADSQGRELTKEQQDYFANSKIRNENGNLIPMYHGSPKTDINSFRLDLGGAYFTANPDYATEYARDVGKVYEVYLNITKPFDTRNAKERAIFENEFFGQWGNGAPLGDKGLPDWTDGDDLIEFIQEKGYDYDGLLLDEGGVPTGDGVKDRGISYVVFDEANQVKAVDNLKPTTSNDIRYSLLDADNLPKLKGSHLTYGEDIKLRTNEDIAPVVENTTDANVVKNATSDIPEGFAPLTEEEAIAYARENFANLTDADAPPVRDTERFNLEDDITIDDKSIRQLAKTVSDTLSMSRGSRTELEQVIRDFSNNKYSTKEDLYNAVESRFGTVYTEQLNDTLADAKDFVRNTKIFVSPTEKAEFGSPKDYTQFMRSNFGKIKFSKEGRGVDAVYQELNEMYPDIFKDDVWNSADQLRRIAEVVNKPAKDLIPEALPSEMIEEATDLIYDSILEYKDTERFNIAYETYNEANEYLFGKDAPIQEAPTREFETIKPRPEKLVGEEEQWAKNKMARADKVKGNAEQTAKIITDEPKVEKKKNRAWSKFVSNFVDKASPFETLALKTGNREVDAKFNAIRYAEGKAQNLIGKGAEGVKALNDIVAEVKADGLTDSLYEYLYHKHNVDRMTLEDRYKDVPNKAVFGDSVTAKVSQDIVEQYEFAEPKLVEYANEIYNYNRHLRKMLVDGGVISQETADLWEEMYPHYVPIRRVGDDGLNINVPLDTGRTGVNAPIKRATGGSRDILPLFDTMAQRTIQTYKAIAKNRFGVELKNTLGTTVENAKTNLDEVIDSIDTQESLLQEGKNGKNPTFTVFENGEKVTFEITEEMYDALKPTSEGLTYTNKALNTINNVRRGLLTEYNPTFMLTNAAKDAQDVLINSQHPARTYKNFPKAIKELATKGGKWYSEYMENGGEQNTYFEKDTNAFKEEKTGFAKLIGMPLDKISDANNFIERIPRLAEYIASREMGRSIDVAMLDSARVTTNFSAGGDVTKFLNRNGATFLNASVQGAVQQVRNVREAKYNGLKGWVQLGAKTMLAGLPALLLNGLLWDDDEEYEELSDYVKENYYIVAKFDDGKFVRIPKGRAVAVIQNAFEQTWNALTGDDEVDLNRFLELAISNLAPNNPLDNNIIAPIMQVANNETWYGEDLVPTRLQDLPNAEQYDESTDAISKWLGEKLNYSPYKINYLLDQYSGGIGDMVLPMLTPEAESGNNSFSGNLLAPIKDKFTTDSVMNNQVVSDFYKTSDELTTNAKSSKATDEDILKYKYINSVQAEMGELYAEKREIQNSNLSDEIKYKKVREIQEEINALSENALNTYGTVNIDGNYANVGDRHYRLNDENEWQKINDKQLEKQEEVTSGLGITPSEYWNNKAEYDYAYDSPEKYAVAKAVGGYSAYKTYSSELYDIHADKDSNGKSISGSRKEKVLDYINNLDIDYYEKLILFKSEYNADDTYNYEIIDYLNNRDDISYEEEVIILRELGFNVDSNGNISW